LLFANTLHDCSQDYCCKHLAQLILRLLLQTPRSTYLKTAVANTSLNWSWDCCCKHLAQLISILLLQTPCSTDLETAVANTLHNWSWDCSNHLLLQMLDAFQNCSQACMTDPRLFWCPECCMLISSEELFLTLFLSKISQTISRYHKCMWKWSSCLQALEQLIPVCSKVLVSTYIEDLFLTSSQARLFKHIKVSQILYESCSHKHCMNPVWTTLKYIMHLYLLSSRTTHSSICCIWTYFICVCYHQNLSLRELNNSIAYESVLDLHLMLVITCLYRFRIILFEKFHYDYSIICLFRRRLFFSFIQTQRSLPISCRFSRSWVGISFPINSCAQELFSRFQWT